MQIVGLMSGTSLDGIDLALCDVSDASCTILAATTRPYSPQWQRRLASLESASALDYAKANVELGHLFGMEIRDFLRDQNLSAEAVASHGHTVFHQPSLGLTAQIGDLDAIAAECGLPVVGNFRTLDVALGGQGAPLVPIGDELLFSQFDACLNLGGIANISFREPAAQPPSSAPSRIAFDICPCNMALNRLAERLGLPYDDEGCNARRGILNQNLNETLNSLDYYSLPAPKSLGKEWFLERFWPLVEGSSLPVEDLLRTVTEHIAFQIATVVSRRGIRSLLVTGGGAYNRFLLECVKKYEPIVEIVLPDDLIINYKEAMIFAMLGYLRLGGRVNALASVTGASRDNIGGNVSGLLPDAPLFRP
ncbi:MAG: anhydro-N-acetylmuramic acid kinase [Bacteroidales bacterium]|nr:anhydro-N-acetylmuramic acid kinase [Bacteroidales bacterium]